MHIFLIILHIVVCIALILVVLLQAGKGASMGAVFGGSSQTIFGSSGPGTFLSKMTTVIAIVFMLTSLGLSYFATSKGGTLMKQTPKPTAPVSAPATPAPAPATETPTVPQPSPPSGQAPAAK
ncbi:MAG: preprotein translocase subunit SecG [Syntrophales bacterium]|nr:preprotein translocase subunit SecG [Syntrophales bacterium]